MHAVAELWAWTRGRRRRLRVEGASMLPTLPVGGFVLVAPIAGADDEGSVPLARGDIVLCRHPSQPIDIVKRVASITQEGLVELVSDNPEAGTDSRHFGSIDPELVEGRVTLLLDAPLRPLHRSS